MVKAVADEGQNRNAVRSMIEPSLPDRETPPPDGQPAVLDDDDPPVIFEFFGGRIDDFIAAMEAERFELLDWRPDGVSLFQVRDADTQKMQEIMDQHGVQVRDPPGLSDRETPEPPAGEGQRWPPGLTNCAPRWPRSRRN